MRKILATLALGLAVVTGALAQAWPSKPVTLLVPFPPGGSTDLIARTLGAKLQEKLGGTFLVDNKAGAGGALAAREVIRAKPDGYTLFFVNNGNLAVVPFVQKDANYDGQKDFTSVALVSSAPLVAVIPAALPVTDLKGFIEYAKKNPVSYASAGIGSFGQLATELLASKAGVKMTHIPYKGQGPTTTAVIAGEVQLLVTTPSAAMNEFIAQKRLKLIAVTSAEPSPLEPGAPTIGSVYPGYAAESWFAIVGPAGMPPDVVAKLNDAVTKAVQLPEVQKSFATFGVIPKTASAKRVAEMTAEEVARWSAVIRDSNIRSE